MTDEKTSRQARAGISVLWRTGMPGQEPIGLEMRNERACSENVCQRTCGEAVLLDGTKSARG